MSKRIDRKTIAQIRKLRKDGLTLREISDKVGTSLASTGKYAKKYRRKPKSAVSKDDSSSSPRRKSKTIAEIKLQVIANVARSTDLTAIERLIIITNMTESDNA